MNSTRPPILLAGRPASLAAPRVRQLMALRSVVHSPPPIHPHGSIFALLRLVNVKPALHTARLRSTYAFWLDPTPCPRPRSRSTLTICSLADCIETAPSERDCDIQDWPTDRRACLRCWLVSRRASRIRDRGDGGRIWRLRSRFGRIGSWV